MNLRSVILALLNWRPASGYDLKQIISDSDIFYWSGNNNQIYKSLVELQNDGLVTHQVQVQEHLPAKKIYSINGYGLSELHRSLLVDPQPPELHKDFLIQLAWAETLSDDEIANLLDRYEEEVANRLQMIRARAAQLSNRPERSKREKYLWERIADNLVNSFQAELDWIRQTRREFREKKYEE
jgi:DNA-binding PadR family transcriptional regulator